MTPPGPGALVAAHYRVRRVLDEGPLGVVVEAEDLGANHERTCAVLLGEAAPVTGPAIVDALVGGAAARADMTRSHLVARLFERGGGRYRERLIGMGFTVVLGRDAPAEAPLTPGAFPGLRVSLHAAGLSIERYRYGWVSAHEEGWLADALLTVEASRLPWDLETFEALVRALAAAAPFLEDPRS